MYKVICAWCGTVLRESNVADSHGICHECECTMRKSASLAPPPKKED